MQEPDESSEEENSVELSSEEEDETTSSETEEMDTRPDEEIRLREILKDVPPNIKKLVEMYLDEDYADSDTISRINKITDLGILGFRTIEEIKYLLDVIQSKREDAENRNFRELVKQTIDKMTVNNIRQIRQLLKNENSEIQEIVENCLEKEGWVYDSHPEKVKWMKDFERISSRLQETPELLKTNILLNGIHAIAQRVHNVFTALRNAENRSKVLDHLLVAKMINEEEHERMKIAPNDMNSYAKAFRGSGIWI